MRAILYVAGIGSRLGSVTEELPKALLEFGGKTLLRRHAENLEAIGVQDLVVVTGWRHEKILDEIARIASHRALRLSPVRNDEFRDGSALSVFAAVPYMRVDAAPLLLMDGDVLYGPEMLQRLVRSKHETCLLIDRACELDEMDPVLVPIRAGRPFDFRKGYQGPWEAIGESIGFFKIGARDVPRFVEAACARTASGRHQETLEDIVQELVREGRFGFEDVTGEPWIEIDFPQDIERAEKEILPALEAESGSSPLSFGADVPPAEGLPRGNTDF